MNKDREYEAEDLLTNSENSENSENDKGKDRDKKRRDLKKRLKEYALRIIRLYESLPKTGAVHIITHQLLCSGTSPGAQYAESSRAKSNADFISKIEGVLQELEESLYWLELLIKGGFVTENVNSSSESHSRYLLACLERFTSSQTFPTLRVKLSKNYLEKF